MCAGQARECRRMLAANSSARASGEDRLWASPASEGTALLERVSRHGIAFSKSKPQIEICGG